MNDSPYHVEIYSEYFDTVLFPDPAVQQEFRDFHIHKYQNRKPDVIVTVGPSPLKFMEEVHQKAYPGIPIVFCLPYGLAPGAPELDSDFTGVENDMAPFETIEIALRLQPGTKNVVVVGGVSAFDHKGLATIKEELKPYEGRLDISYLTDLAVPDLLKSLEHLPDHTLVLLTTVGQDAAGHSFKSNEIGHLVADAANAPVFSLFDVYLNHGEVGGYLSSLSEQGKVAGSMALRLLRGARPQDIGKTRSVNTYMFDWRAIKRWGLMEKEIPPGSIVLNRQLTVWQSYKWYIIDGTTLISLETLLIFALVWQRAKRLKSEKAVRASEERLRLAQQTREEMLKIFVKHIPAAVAMLDHDMRYLQVSDRWCADFSLESSEILGRSHYEVLPDAPDRWKEIHSRALAGETLRAEEDRWDRQVGGTTWLRWEIRPWQNLHGVPGGILIFSEDITHRKHAEEALVSLSGRLIEAQDEERKRISREIHDDYSQRVAMLSLDLEQLADDVGDSSGETRQKFQELFDRISELGADLHSLSHRLHSSTLESLGLLAGLEAFCKEFAEQQGMQVDFVCEKIPRAVPGDAALCMFRITQEALRNIKRHSGANRADVRLEQLDGRLHLTVSDRGRGFNSNKPPAECGIGIHSMEERVRLLGGELEIQSRPMEGTRIDAWLPLKMASAA